MPQQDTSKVWPPAPLSVAGRQKSEKLRHRVAPSFWSAVTANVLVLLIMIPRVFLRQGEMYDDFGLSALCVILGGGFLLANVPYSFYCLTGEGIRRQATAVVGLFLTVTPIPV